MTVTESPGSFDYDFVIVGSGFGGSVSALRLSEKGYRVCVLEAGKRFNAEDFPKTNWNLRRFLWMPRAGLHGILRMTLLPDVLILSGAGVGGGSLVYANTLLVPPDAVFRNARWPEGLDWQARLAPFYREAQRMLGVNPVQELFPADRVLLKYAQAIGRTENFHSAQVGVYFGEPGKTVADPFFGGQGPERTGCIHCGGCMVGCRFGAKNTLDKNYLYLAERAGATIEPERQVERIVPLPAGGYRIVHRRSTSLLGANRRELTARGVVVAAGALGTVELLLRCKTKGDLPALADCLGDYVRTNSEAIVGARANGNQDYSTGLAITSGVYVDDDTHIEVVRYPKGSDALAPLSTLLTDNGTRLTRPLRFLANIARHPLQFLRTLNPFGWAQRTIVLLVMQSLDSRMQLVLRRSWLRPWRRQLSSRTSAGNAVPGYIPAANAAARAVAKAIHGTPLSSVNEVLLNIPMTAHILGGCPMGSSAADGVVDAQHRAFGYRNLYVIDGSTVPVNLGVNPSLTITAMAEHAMSHIPHKH